MSVDCIAKVQGGNVDLLSRSWLGPSFVHECLTRWLHAKTRLRRHCGTPLSESSKRSPYVELGNLPNVSCCRYSTEHGRFLLLTRSIEADLSLRGSVTIATIIQKCSASNRSTCYSPIVRKSDSADNLHGVAAPNCPECLEPMEAVVSAWWCESCKTSRTS